MDKPGKDAPFLSIEQLYDYVPKEDRSELPSFQKSLPPAVLRGQVMDSQYADFCLRVIAAYVRQMKDALELYRPLPAAAKFHASQARSRLLCGSNQAGKTVCAMTELAYISRDKDPFQKYPGGNLSLMVVGKDQDHVGSVLWKKLWYPGAFEIVPDEETGFWRAVRPDPRDPYNSIDPIDVARKHLWRPAPPLIPPDDIKRLSWELAGEAVPSQCVLANGTEIAFQTSRGSPRQGIQLHGAFFDEELLNKDWYRETMPRLVRYNGFFVWSATPQASTPQFYDLHRRVLDGDPGIEEFKLLIEENPYFSRESKEALYRDYLAMGEDELNVRWHGLYAIAGRQVYPTYDPRLHMIEPVEIPPEWMRVMAVDPGTTVAAAIFGAVPPDASCIHVYAEVICRNKTAEQFARECRRVIGGHRFEAFIIDKRGGRQKSMGGTDRTCDRYSKAFQEVDIPRSRLSGHGFIYGSDLIEARELSVKRLLAERRLKLHAGRTYWLNHQFQNRFYDKDNPEKREKAECDALDALEYLVAFFDEPGLYHHKPKIETARIGSYDLSVWQSLQRKKRMERKKGL